MEGTSILVPWFLQKERNSFAVKMSQKINAMKGDLGTQVQFSSVQSINRV